MRTVRSVSTVHAALLVALGLSSSACGGSTANVDGQDGGGPDHDGGATTDGSVLFDSGNHHVDGSSGDNRFPCTNPQPILVNGQDTGYDSCGNGVVRRRDNVACPTALPRANHGACSTADSGLGPSDACHSDDDCTASPHGFCSKGNGFEGPSTCTCTYGCTKDSECGSGQICECGDPVGFCVSATCTTGASCAPGFDCASYTNNPGCPSTAFACQTPADTCVADSDCAGGEQCTLQGVTRVCQHPGCAVGRPFLVAGAPRLAPAIARSDWYDDRTPCLEGLAQDTRAELALAWVEIARMEHASIAAFARFALQLLAASAPPDLVLAAQQAMRDETAHARIAFGLARAYGGADIGPGALAMDGCLDATDLAELAATVFLEGCIGETVAAIEAREGLEHAKDAVIRAALAQIATDETAHAELAWKTVAWAMNIGGERVRARIESLLADAEASHRAPASHHEEADLLAHGIVNESQRSALRRVAIATVIGPCASALLDRARAGYPASLASAASASASAASTTSGGASGKASREESPRGSSAASNA